MSIAWHDLPSGAPEAFEEAYAHRAAAAMRTKAGEVAVLVAEGVAERAAQLTVFHEAYSAVSPLQVPLRGWAPRPASLMEV